jgi:CDP-glucose 4,6-dehydratase
VEPICGYILLAQSLWSDPISYSAGWNFGPNEESVRTVGWIVDNLKRTWGGDASWILDAVSQSPHESISLKLDPTKTRQELGWQVRLDLEEALKKTVVWHRGWINGENCRKQTLKQIDEYIGTIER